MDIQKRNEYEKTMSLNGIDTLSGYIPDVVTYKDMRNGIKENISKCNYQPDKKRTHIVVNPNKKTGSSEKLITKYSEFLEKMNFILASMDRTLDDMDVIRADFCFNSTDISSYRSYQKLHRLLISCLAKAYKYKNCYVSDSLWNFERLSVAIKKDDSEIENYNKYRESDGKDESTNRLELRSKRMSGTTIEYQFMTKWFERLDKAQKLFEDVQKEYNDQLEKLYKDDLQKPPKERNYLSLNAFLLQYKECIYARKQMIDLVGRFEEVKNPEKKADKFKEKHKIEYFSKKDLEHIIKVLKKKTVEYFNS